jgi:hypothetical protein
MPVRKPIAYLMRRCAVMRGSPMSRCAASSESVTTSSRTLPALGISFFTDGWRTTFSGDFTQPSARASS